MQKEGKVVAVCTSARGGVPKYPREEVQVSRYGLVGDYHAGETRVIRRTGRAELNHRQISLVAKEVLDNLSKELGISLSPGDLGENITTEGLGDLADLNDGATLRIAGAVTLKVSGQNAPCENLSVYHRLLVKKIYGRRGIVAAVVDGAGSRLRAGDTIEVL